MIMENILHRDLPKWPQMYTTGKPITVEQAKEIIRRTDTFFTHGYGGNDRQYDARVREAVGMPQDPWTYPRTPTQVEWKGYHEKYRAWSGAWNGIQTSYVFNSWISCAFIGGPHGWCHPTGDIGFVDNVGKWPSIEAIAEDWTKIAEAFPFLDVGVTLMDRESCEDGKNKVAGLRVLQGKVEVVDPAVVDVHAGHPEATRAPGNAGNSLELDVAICMNAPARLREHGIVWEWFEEWGQRHRRIAE